MYKSGGSAILTIKRKSGENLSLNLPWGNDLYSYCEGKQIYSPNGPVKTEIPSVAGNLNAAMYDNIIMKLKKLSCKDNL